MNDRIPCRVSADLRRHQAEQNKVEPSETPDFTDAEQVRQVASVELGAPIANLMSARDQVLALMGRQRVEALPVEVHDMLRSVAELERALFKLWSDS